MFRIETYPRPQVLLLGNGLNRTFGGISWGEVMQKITLRDDLPSKLTCPMPLQAMLVTNDHVDECMKKNQDAFYGKVSEELMEPLQTLLSMGFSDILTTNYSYELEAASQNQKIIHNNFLKKTCKNVNDGYRVENKYLLSSCQQIQFQSVDNRIWHIHGEARKPSSMILGHYDYGSLLCKMKNYADSHYEAYLSYRKNDKEISMQGWLDSFILGDVYILGFGMDFSELDLWWLINRKKREHTSDTHVYYYDFATRDLNEKHELLKLMGAEVYTFGIEFPSGDSNRRKEICQDFYGRAIADIHNRMRVLEPV